jgi:hypothetical protein
MRRALRARLSFANVVSLLALFIAIGGSTYAATGGNFILGQPNSASSTTSLSAPVAGKALQVTNNSGFAGATALGLTTENDVPPLTVNSPAKVNNLNVDRLDGKDSTAFIQGNGNVQRRAGKAAPGQFIQLELDNGVFGLQYGCPADLSQNGSVNVFNRAGAIANLFVDTGDAAPLYLQVVNGGSFADSATAPRDAKVYQMQVGNGRFATIWLFSVHRQDKNDCYAQFHALITRG